MIEFDSETLRPNRGSPIHTKLENGWFVVTWRKDPDNTNPSFRFPFTFLCRILNEFFKDNEWLALSADHSKFPLEEFGKFVVDNGRQYFPPSPQYGSAIAGIMYTLELIEFEERPGRGRPIFLRKRIGI